jgi:lipoprotein-anchoring transpeptidase ErfK/SrfK
VYRQINGWRRSPLGLLYRPKYFRGGYALHGSNSVPAYPASHGCVRVSLRAMDHLWSRVPIGTRVRIY